MINNAQCNTPDDEMDKPSKEEIFKNRLRKELVSRDGHGYVNIEFTIFSRENLIFAILFATGIEYSPKKKSFDFSVRFYFLQRIVKRYHNIFAIQK